MTNQQLNALLSSADDVISGSKNQCMCPGHKKGSSNILNKDNLTGFAIGMILCLLYKRRSGGGAYDDHKHLHDIRLRPLVYSNIERITALQGGANKHIQGYDDRRDESLSARLGAERKFQHGKYSVSEHGRMDDSYGVHGHRGLKGPMMPGF